MGDVYRYLLSERLLQFSSSSYKQHLLHQSPCMPYIGHLIVTSPYSATFNTAPRDPATTMYITLLLNVIAVYFILRRWRSYTDHLLENIKPPWPPSASYSNMSPWISNTASKLYNIHRSTISFSVATCVPGDPSLVLGSNSSSYLDSNTPYNDPYYYEVYHTRCDPDRSQKKLKISLF